MTEKPSLQTDMSNHPVIAACRSAFIVVGLFSFGINLLMLAVPLYMMQIFDRVLATRNLDTLLALTGIALLAIAVLGCLEIARSALMVRCGAGIDRQLSPDVLDACTRSAKRGDSGFQPGAQGLRDIALVRSYLSGPAVMALFDAPFVPLFLAVVFLIHPLLGWIAFAGAMVLLLLAFANEFITRSPIQESGRQSASALNNADAALRNFDVIEAMGMMDTLKARWQGASEESLGYYQEASDRASTISAIARAARLGLQIAMLGTGAWLAMYDVISGGAMIGASIIAARALAPFEQSINGWKALVSAQDAFRRVRALLQGQADAITSTKLPKPAGRLSVDGIIYIPPGCSEPTLRDVSFELFPGTCLGIIGPSAAGKTTLVRHLVGSLTPTRGHVRLDGAEMSQWHASDRGKWIGYLPQDVELFRGTVHENIARMTRADDARVVEAAQLAGAHEAILELPEGYDTLIQPAHGVLSGGQRQRIGLARALFGLPRLLVLDEPNANLDGEGEQALLRAIVELKKLGTTIVMVAHRPTVMSAMDRLLMLRSGRVVALGDRDEILGQLAAPLGMQREDRSTPVQGGA